MKALKARVYKVLEAGHSYDWASRTFDLAMATLILLNVIAFSIETIPEIASRHARFFAIFDFASVAIFTVEYLLRLWVCTEHPPLRGLSPWRARLHFARNPFMVVDFLAIAPFYLAIFAPLDLRVLRVFRLLRFFRLARFSPAFNTLLRVVAVERSALIGVAIVLAGLMIVAASLLYLVEGYVQPDKFGSVPKAMWWAIATLTTVGYGDVTPITPAGKMLAGLVMVFGLGSFALPIGIIASGFMEEYRRRDFILSWGMAARAPIFSDLKPEAVAELLTVLKARIAPPGSVIAIDGERPGALFIIGSGEVEISDADEPEREPVQIGEGQYWGARSLLTGVQTKAAKALTTCDLIVLDQDDFRALARSKPHIHQQLLAAIAASRDLFDIPQGVKSPPESGD
ncbi:MAG: cyclic nucleotide-gated ion channel [Parvularculaceae bacterium]